MGERVLEQPPPGGAADAVQQGEVLAPDVHEVEAGHQQLIEVLDRFGRLDVDAEEDVVVRELGIGADIGNGREVRGGAAVPRCAASPGRRVLRIFDEETYIGGVTDLRYENALTARVEDLGDPHPLRCGDTHQRRDTGTVAVPDERRRRLDRHRRVLEVDEHVVRAGCGDRVKGRRVAGLVGPGANGRPARHDDLLQGVRSVAGHLGVFLGNRSNRTLRYTHAMTIPSEFADTRSAEARRGIVRNPMVDDRERTRPVEWRIH